MFIYYVFAMLNGGCDWILVDTRHTFTMRWVLSTQENRMGRASLPPCPWVLFIGEMGGCIFLPTPYSS
jgi:hypothetical protein